MGEGEEESAANAEDCVFPPARKDRRKKSGRTRTPTETGVAYRAAESDGDAPSPGADGEEEARRRKKKKKRKEKRKERPIEGHGDGGNGESEDEGEGEEPRAVENKRNNGLIMTASATEMGDDGGGKANKKAEPTKMRQKDDSPPTLTAEVRPVEDVTPSKAPDVVAADRPFWTRKKLVACALLLSTLVVSSIVAGVVSSLPAATNLPPPPDAPSTSPSADSMPSASFQEEEAILWRLAEITPEGVDALLDTATPHHGAFTWIVHDDGMELGAASDHLHQRYVLMVVYLVSGPWTPVEGQREWGSPVHECEWEGVFCKDVRELEAELGGRFKENLVSGADGGGGFAMNVPRRVVNRLSLQRRLVAPLPPEFSLLHYLQYLDLEGNRLVGALPAPIRALPHLETLFLEQNYLTNVEAVGEFRFLKHLSLSQNDFRGPLPDSFKNLKNLQTLYLHTNKFTGRVFDIIKDFTSVEILDLAFNDFEGTLPAELGGIKNLTRVSLGHNGFRGTVPNEIGSCKNLKEFQIDGSPDVGGPIPDALGRLPALEFLKLDSCAFNGTLPSNLGDLLNLRYLDVTSNDLGGTIPIQLGKASSLSTLALANNDFEGGVPTELGKLTKLEKLFIQNTDLSGSMPKEVCDLRTRGDAIFKVLWVPCNMDCDVETCCTDCS